MKKPSRQKSTAELERSAAAKRAANLEACYAYCRKHGVGVQFSFLRIFRRGLEIEENEAVLEFEKAVKAGKIVEVGSNPAGDVKYFAVK